MEEKKPRILIADDDKYLVSDLEMALAKEPFSICSVDSAEKEIEEARKGYDFILTDLQMPEGKEGIYAIREIRKFDQKVPIVLHTSFESEDIRREALDAGATYVAWKSRTGIFDYAPMIRQYMKTYMR